MAIITKDQLENAAVDAQTLEDVVNGALNPGTLQSRLGTELKTLAKIIDDLANQDIGVTAAAIINQKLDELAIEILPNLAPNPLWLSALNLNRFSSTIAAVSSPAASPFEGPGNEVSIPQGATNGGYYIDADDVYTDEEYIETGKISINVEIVSVSAQTVDFHVYGRDPSGPSFPFLGSSGGTAFAAGELKIINLTFDVPAGLDRVTFQFRNSPTDLRMGKFFIAGGDKQNLLSLNDIFTVIENQSEELPTNLTPNPLWLNELDSARFSSAIVPVVSTAAAPFEGPGNEVLIPEGATNGGYRVITDTIYAHLDYEDGGNVSVNFELVSTATQNIQIQIYGRDLSGPSYPLLYNGPIESVATNEKKNYNLNISLPLNLDSFQIQFRGTPTDDIRIGKLSIFVGNNSSFLGNTDSTLIVVSDVIKKTVDPKPTGTIRQWGDSLTNTASSYGHLSDILDRGVVYRGFAGERSYQIKERLYLEGQRDDTHVFWVGSNNVTSSVLSDDVVLTDIKEMIDFIGHDRYVVVGWVSGDYADRYKGTGTYYDTLIRFEQRAEELLGDRFVNVRKAMIEGYTYSFTHITSSYTQPAVNSNVSISLDDASSLSVGNRFTVGRLILADTYEVVSISGNNVTSKLIAADLIPTGSTVENEFYDGPFGNFGATNNLMVIKEDDYLSYQRDIHPDGFRYDNIHLEEAGDLFVAQVIADKLLLLGY